ncbi:MAG: sugar transferase, partial [Dehalococcoidia bacterium]
MQPVDVISDVRKPGALAVALKRAFDLIGGALCLILFTPILLIVALAICIDSRGPVIYKGRRFGRNGQIFVMYKFRTMVQDAEVRLADVIHLNRAVGNQVKIPDDPRCTRVGRFLRRTSIDELPNLINVVRGEMSLIGPRPHT